MIKLTPAAADQVRRAAEQSGASELALRVAARWDDAQEMYDFGIGFDERREKDDEYVSEGITVLVSPVSRDAVQGLVVDYVELEPGDFRFIFYREGRGAAPQPPA